MWNAWLDLGLGSRCVVCAEPGRVLCASCAAELPSTGHRVRPDPEPLGLMPVFVAGGYASPLGQMLIAHKEHGVYGLAEPLGRLLAQVVMAATEPSFDLLLVTVPSPRSAVRRRGHDPVGRMVRAATRELRAAGRPAITEPVLVHRRSVADQSGLAAAQRAENLAGALGVDHRVHRRLAGQRLAVVVCDDIVTTGATAREAQRALGAVGLSTIAIAAVAATERRLPGTPRSG